MRAIRPLTTCRLFQYPLFRIVDCFRPPPVYRRKCGSVSISALSDRGLLRASGVSGCSGRCMFQYPLFRIVDCFGGWRYDAPWGNQRFNIRSFGSWIASRPFPILITEYRRFNIRSFGSWIASKWRSSMDSFGHRVSISALSDRGLLHNLLFAYLNVVGVSISALSDRGLLQASGDGDRAADLGFNIRSFGSWIASSLIRQRRHRRPLRFNIRSFGSWIASLASSM